jgi:hypothetical protein
LLPGLQPRTEAQIAGQHLINHRLSEDVEPAIVGST